MTKRTVLLATAKQMPCAPRIMAVLMPMTSPADDTSAPPELPGLSAASVWMTSSIGRPLRDISERVIVASKGRFDRARSVKQRAADELPHESTLLTDDFLTLTLDIWSIPPESARRVGHPAPFPVELPEQLIRLYTYEDDLVLDPFMGSGSALVAAAIEKTGAAADGMKAMGKVMGVVTPQVKGRADGGAVAAEVRRQLG